MSVFEVQFLDRKTTILPVLSTAYNFKPKGRLVWLQKLMWGTLNRFGALSQHYDSQEKVQYLRIDTDDFMERLFRQRSSIADHFDHEAKTLLIGAEDFSELMSCQRPGKDFAFFAQYFCFDGGRKTVMGVEIRVIPWMTGMVVI